METLQNKTNEPVQRKLIRPRGEKLKAERVQDKLKAERVQDKLRSMPGWRFARRGQTLHRVREFPDHQVASAFAGFAGAFAARAKQPADITLSGSRVLVVLHPKSRGGLSDAVLDLAKSLG
ncbi:MAG TPA: 4a-hydroxytetrahydrobiopterin dehydratase [Thermoanaerobaculia bacterium]|nr:4a-hydroxytetrahydrobiopterin dehydratase [Thermoanaerobaculia bacterium]